MTKNQVQISFMMKCIEASQVTLTTHLTRLYIIAWIQFYLHSLTRKILTELKSSQFGKEEKIERSLSRLMKMRHEEILHVILYCLLKVGRSIEHYEGRRILYLPFIIQADLGRKTNGLYFLVRHEYPVNK